MVSKFFSVLKTALLVGTVRNCVKITSLTFEGIFPSAVLVDGTFTQDAVDAPSVNSFKNQLAKRRLRQMDFLPRDVHSAIVVLLL